MKKKILQKILKILAKKVLNKYKPDVIGITGSVGKTSSKEAIYTVLKGSKKRVRQTPESYNNEIGVPLTILGMILPYTFIGWLKVFIRGFGLILSRDKSYPEILVLEMAADHPGDIKYLTELAPCKIGVVTAIAPVHLEFFRTVENIAKEKQVLVSHLKSDNWAVLNGDDDLTFEMQEKTQAKVLTFGFLDRVRVKAKEPMISHETGTQGQELISGMNFKLSYKGSAVPVLLSGALGEHQIYSALAAATVGVIYDLNLVEISQALRNYRSPRGRMNLIKGIKHTLIIDDTYNSSPKAAFAALEVLKKFPLKEGKRKFAVLGDMLELGSFTREGHEEVGRRAFEAGLDGLITVGEKARDIAVGARESGLSQDKIFTFSDTDKAGQFLQQRIKEGDLILIKGSQGMRMEKIVKEIMDEPLKANELLVRQDESWEKR
ncbi:MAG: hypothetical protein COY04_01340 [Parcubacteria group bacterium CG_4_10_14_0_2_um_filter_7_35_8]|nr:MAG: hypothetical protein COY04_01340 [Parcubacteria group bacterium CG_4_10_14_0_2_um_filter_7_35_8]